MSVTSPQRTWSEPELVRAVRDFLRLEVIGVGHIAPAGEVHVTDHTILAHAGAPSVFNRGTALDFSQPDVTFGELDGFFSDLPHTLWLDAATCDGQGDAVLRSRGYLPMPTLHAVATERFPEELAHADPALHANLLTDPAKASQVADVTATGFGLGVEDRLLFEDLARGILRHAKPWSHGAIYGIERDQRLVSVGSLLCTADVAGISALATLPTHRHQSHGSVIVSRALHDAAALGYRAAVSLATPDSAKVFERLGFRRVADYRVYRQSRP